MKLLKNKNAQVTIFILMGIVIISVFAVVFNISETLNNYATEKEAEQIIENFFDQASFRQTITYCLSTSATESINLISRQGGYILPHQPSSMLNYIETLEWNNYNTTYAIIEPDLNSEEIDRFPCIDEFTDSIPCPYSHNSNFFTFGKNNPTLHKSNHIPPLYKEYIPGYTSYFNYDYSFQEQLEKIILNLTLRCSNITTNSDIHPDTLKYGEPKINVSIGINDIRTKVTFPLKIKLRDRERKTYSNNTDRTAWITKKARPCKAWTIQPENSPILSSGGAGLLWDSTVYNT